ncbi:MAG: hypothetical protein QE278_14005 [Limnobacter sp.]|nr:hypothetical protein [Limnobacter sp.]
MSPSRFDAKTNAPSSAPSSTPIGPQASPQNSSRLHLLAGFGRMAHAVSALFQGLSASMEGRSEGRSEGIKQYVDRLLSNLTCCVSDDAEADLQPGVDPALEQDLGVRHGPQLETQPRPFSQHCRPAFASHMRHAPGSERSVFSRSSNSTHSNALVPYVGGDSPNRSANVNASPSKTNTDKKTPIKPPLNLGFMPELAWLKQTRFVRGAIVNLPGNPISRFRRYPTSHVRSKPTQPPKMLDFLTLENGQRGWIKRLEQAVQQPRLYHTIRTCVSECDEATGQYRPRLTEWSGVHVGDNYLLIDLVPLSQQERAQYNLNRLGPGAHCMRATVFSPSRKTTFEVIFRELDAEPKKSVSFREPAEARAPRRPRRTA